MEKRYYYELREVIFGLRSEYLKNREKLKELRRLCISDDKKVKDFFFAIWEERGMNPELICEFIQKESKLSSKLKELMHLQTIGKTSAICVKDNNDRYYIINPFYNASIIPRLEKEFSLQADEILNSDFVKRIKISELTSGITFNDSMISASLQTTQERIDFSIYRENKYFNKFSSIYVANGDAISFIMLDKNIPATQLENIFYIRIPKNQFNDYQQDIIESNSSTKKQIVFADANSKKIGTNYNIEEDEKQIVLRKRK